jgi:hypothetical protein
MSLKSLLEVSIFEKLFNTSAASDGAATVRNRFK